MIGTLMQSPPLVAEVERAFRHFNKHLFSNGLPDPIFTLVFDKRLGIKYRAESHEFAIGSGIDSWSGDKFVCELLHEMIHCYNSQRGVTDCTSNQYHNQEFVQVALEVGFYVSKHRTRGMARTTWDRVEDDESTRAPERSANERLKSLVISLKFKEDKLKAAQRCLQEQQRTTPSKTFLFKWICECPPPHNCIRSGRRPGGPNPLDITCNKCGAIFKAASDD